MKIRMAIISLLICVLMSCGGGGGDSSSGATANEFTYKFDETSGSTANNTAGDSFNGTIFGASRVTGKIGNALHFGSSGSRVEIYQYNSPINFNENTLSIDAWINMDTVPANSICQIVGNGYYGSTSFRLQINNGRLEMLLSEGVVWRSLILGNQVLSANTWNHIAFTYNGSTANTYINGTIDNSINITSKILSNYNMLYIATSDDYSSNVWQKQFLGTIDELRISKTYRTSSEVNNYYLSTK